MFLNVQLKITLIILFSSYENVEFLVLQFNCNGVWGITTYHSVEIRIEWQGVQSHLILQEGYEGGMTYILVSWQLNHMEHYLSSLTEMVYYYVLQKWQMQKRQATSFDFFFKALIMLFGAHFMYF